MMAQEDPELTSPKDTKSTAVQRSLPSEKAWEADGLLLHDNREKDHIAMGRRGRDMLLPKTPHPWRGLMGGRSLTSAGPLSGSAPGTCTKETKTFL